MVNNNILNENYWISFDVKKTDIEFIYNYLLEKETPQSTNILIQALVEHRIASEKEKQLTSSNSNEKIYFPKDQYSVGDTLVFPSLGNIKGEITAIRTGFNPDVESLSVISVELEDKSSKSFASGVEDHPLNHFFDLSDDDPNFDSNIIMENHGPHLTEVIEASLVENEDLVRIAGNWFPRSLLVDIHLGHLNLVEAILEEAHGGPIGTAKLMDLVDLNAGVERNLLEFSFNLALQEDERFDEVGPAGETLWFLHAMEPEFVRKTPLFLKNSVDSSSNDTLDEYLALFDSSIFDELEKQDFQNINSNEAVISLSYPHWRSGTLPLPRTLSKMFPTAYEAPRVRFTFVDGNEKFSGWVIRAEKYVYGFADWYKKNDIISGSLIKVSKGKTPGEINISFDKSRQNKEWLKTILVGSDNGIVFAMLKQPINADYNDRMALVVTDVEALDDLWKKKTFSSEPLQKTVNRILRELIKLNPQGQVHGQEIYASVNVLRRCPPGSVIQVLLADPAIEYLGDLYFRFKEKGT